MLDNKRLTPIMFEAIKAIPLDDEADKNCYDNISHITKVKIYDEKCKGCGYMRIEVGDEEHFLVFHSIEQAIDCAMHTGKCIRRTCEYPTNIEQAFGKNIYPSLTMIVLNGCRLWYANTCGQ